MSTHLYTFSPESTGARPLGLLPGVYLVSGAVVTTSSPAEEDIAAALSLDVGGMFTLAGEASAVVGAQPTGSMQPPALFVVATSDAAVVASGENVGRVGPFSIQLLVHAEKVG